MRLVIYSHSSYFDCLEICVGELMKYGEKPFVIANKEFKDTKTLIYNESLSYSERLIQVLKQVDDEIILFLHEDHLVFSKPDWETIGDLNYYSKNSFDFIKLCFTGNLQLGNLVHYNTFELLDSPDWFAAQPTIWRKESLISFLEKAGPHSIWDLERNGGQFMQGLRGGIYLDGTEKHVGGHRNSNIFPCVLTAICKGRWNMKEYKEELNFLFQKYKLDSNIRGYD